MKFVLALIIRLVSKICIRYGLLIPGSDGKATRPERIPALSEKGTTEALSIFTKAANG